MTTSRGMPDADASPGYYAHLTYNAPLSAERASRLVDVLAATRPRTVLDLGCGWGELLLQVLAAVPDATGVGVDTDSRALARGQGNAGERGLADRVTFIEGPAAEIGVDPADAVLCLGSGQAFGGVMPALRALFPLVQPGGRLLFGDGFWDRPPSADVVALLDDPQFTDLAGMVDQSIETGFRPLSVGSATRAEWEEFESGFLADWEVWLLDHPGHPDVADVRSRADAHREGWLRGYRNVLGFSYLILGRSTVAG